MARPRLHCHLAIGRAAIRHRNRPFCTGNTQVRPALHFGIYATFQMWVLFESISLNNIDQRPHRIVPYAPAVLRS